MKVVSTAGDFEITVTKDVKVEGDYVVLKGQMGVWDSEIYMSANDIWQFTSVFLQPSVILFLLKLPFKFLFGNKEKEPSNDKNRKDL